MIIGRFRALAVAITTTLAVSTALVAAPSPVSAAGATISGTVTVDTIAVDNTGLRYDVTLVDTADFSELGGTVAPDGTYSVTDIPDGTYWVRATDTLLGTQRFHPSAEFEFEGTSIAVVDGDVVPNIDIDLPFFAALTGTISDGTGTVPDVELSLSSTDFADFRQGQASFAGEFAIAVTPGLAYTIELRPPNGAPSYYDQAFAQFAALPVFVPPEGTNVDITLPSGSISGSIVSGGFTASDVVVRNSDGGATLVPTDGSTYSVAYLAAGTYQLSLLTGSGEIPITDYTSDGVSAAPLDLVVPTGSITGEVRSGGTPVDGNAQFYDVALYDSNGSFLRGGFVDGTGTYTFDALPDGDYLVSVFDGSLTTWHPSTSDQFSASVITVSGSSAETADVDLVVPATISGRVTTSAGGVEGVWVSAQSDFGGGGGASTDVDGDYTVQVQPGDYRLLFSPNNGPSTYLDNTGFDGTPIITVGSGENSIDNNLALPDGGLRGTLTDGTNPIGGELFVSDTSNPDNQFNLWVDGATGLWEVLYLTDGTYEIRLDGNPLGTADVVGGAITENIALSPPSGSIDGTIRVDGTAVDGSQTFYDIGLVDPTGNFLRSTPAGADGSYRFENVADGTYTIQATNFDNWRVRWHTDASTFEEATFVEIVGGNALTDIDVDFVSPPGSISGTVRSAVDGSPISGVRVFDDSGFNSTTTDQNGEYTLAGLEPRPYRIALDLEGRIAYYLDDFDSVVTVTEAQPVVEDINFDLPTGGFEGTVDLAPIGGGFATLSINGPVGGSTSLDFGGAFRFDYLPAGTYDFMLSLDDGQEIFLGTATTDGVTVETAVDFGLPLGSISGTVILNGAPFVGDFDRPVVLGLFSEDRDEVRTVTSFSSDGSFTIDFVAPGDYRLSANVSNGVGVAAWYPNLPISGTGQIFTVGAAALENLDITLPDAGAIAGTVLDSDANGVSTSVVLVDPNGQVVPGGPFGQAVTGTDFDGSYRFDDVAAGDYFVQANIEDPATFRNYRLFHPNTYDLDLASPVTVTASTDAPADIDVPAPHIISGTVTGPSGGLDGATVSIVTNDFFSDFATIVATTDVNGDYTTPPLLGPAPLLRFDPPADQVLAPQYYDGVPSSLSATPAPIVPGATTTGINASLGEFGSISGLLTDTSGSTRDGFVRILPANAERPEAAQLEGVEVGDDGVFSFDQVAPGEWVVLAESLFEDFDNQFAPTFSGEVLTYADAVPFLVTSGAATDASIVAQPGRSISGVVTDPDGNPVEGLEVNNFSTRILFPDGEEPFYPGRRTYTAADGSYTLRGLPPGQAVLYFALPNGSRRWVPEFSQNAYTEATAPAIAVPASGPIPDVDVQLEEPVTGVITISDDDGPVDLRTATGAQRWQFAACVDPVEPNPSSITFCDDNVFTSSPAAAVGGQLVANGLAPGTYNVAGVFSSFFGGGSNQATDTVDLVVGAGDTFSCDLYVVGSTAGTSACTVGPIAATGSITGTLSAPDGGPANGITVTATSADASPAFDLPVGRGYTAADGTYVIENLPTGDYYVYATPPFFGPLGFPSFDEWYSIAGDVYFENVDEADIVSVTNGVVTGSIDIALDLSMSGTATVTGTDGDNFVSVIVCPTGSTFGGFFDCQAPDGSTTFARSGSAEPGQPIEIGGLPSGGFDLFAQQFGPSGFLTSDTVTISLPKLSTFTCDFALESPGGSSCTVSPLVDDNDGVDNAEEQGAPNDGDGNNDGVDDANQESVASLEDPSIPDPNDTGENYVTISATEQATDEPQPLANVELIVPPAENPPPGGATPQSSLIAFEVLELPVDVVTPAVAELEIFLPAQANSYFKYDPVSEEWTDATSLATFDPAPVQIGGVDRWRVVLTITDGGFGDDDEQINGEVVDPGLFAFDDTPPTITCPPTPTYLLNDAAATLTFEVTDGGPEATPTTLSVAVDTSEAGPIDVPVSASDSAGNTASTTCAADVHYVISDFGFPLDADRINRWRAGTPLVLFWNIDDANGVGVSAVSATPTISTQRFECRTDEPITEIEVDDSGIGPGHLFDGIWAYVFLSDRSDRGCYTISGEFDSGQTESIQIKLVRPKRLDWWRYF